MITLMHQVVHKVVAKKVRVHHQRVKVLIVMTLRIQVYLSVQIQIYIMIRHLQVVGKMMKTVLIIQQHRVVSLLKYLHLQMVRNILLLLVEKLLRDMIQRLLLKKHLLQVLEVNHLQLKKHLLQVLEVNHLQRHQFLNYS